MKKTADSSNVSQQFDYIIKICSLLSNFDTDLSPVMMPAGNNFPDFLYLNPMTTERTPEVTEITQ